MPSYVLSVAVFVMVLARIAICQTFTACNPMEKSGLLLSKYFKDRCTYKFPQLVLEILLLGRQL
jgi:hypothetical protein